MILFCVLFSLIMVVYHQVYWPLFLFVTIVGCIGFTRVLIKQKLQLRLKKSGIEDILQMDGFQFENYLATLFRDNGYAVKVTSARGDFGADLLLSKDGKKIAVQAKRYIKPVGIKAVQEVIAAATYYKTNESWVVATNSFTKSAKALAHASEVKLIDKENLISMILKMNPEANEVASNTLKKIKPKDIRCKKCGGVMSVKKGKYGNFYGCSHYPRCTHTQKVGS